MGAIVVVSGVYMAQGQGFLSECSASSVLLQ